MERKEFWRSARFVGMVLLMIGLMTAGTSLLFAQTNLKFAHESPTSNARHKAAMFFAEQVAKNSGGKAKVVVYHSGQLGGERQLIEALSLGGIDFTVAGAGMFAAYAPALELIEMPYLFPSYEKAHEVIDGPFGKKLTEPLKNKNIEFLAFWENGFRHVTNNVRPIVNPEDLKGVKIRTNKSKMRMETFKAYGSTPVPIDFPELYMAMSQGVVDGQENPLSNIYPSKFYEVQKYLSLTGHVYGALPMAASGTTWKKLSSELKDAIQKSSIEAGKYHRGLIRGEDDSLAVALKDKGMKINTPPDIKPFQKYAHRVWDLYRETLGDALVNEIIKAAGAE